MVCLYARKKKKRMIAIYCSCVWPFAVFVSPSQLIPFERSIGWDISNSLLNGWVYSLSRAPDVMSHFAFICFFLGLLFLFLNFFHFIVAFVYSFKLYCFCSFRAWKGFLGNLDFCMSKICHTIVIYIHIFHSPLSKNGCNKHMPQASLSIFQKKIRTDDDDDDQWVFFMSSNSLKGKSARAVRKDQFKHTQNGMRGKYKDTNIDGKRPCYWNFPLLSVFRSFLKVINLNSNQIDLFTLSNW